MHARRRDRSPGRGDAGRPGGADHRRDDTFKLGEQLTPGSAALIMLVREANSEKLLSEVRIPGEIIHTSISNDAEEALRDALQAAGQK